MFWRPFSATEREKQLATELEATKRELRVVEAERDALAAVIARDRMRVAAETARFARRRAEYESNGAAPRDDRD